MRINDAERTRNDTKCLYKSQIVSFVLTDVCLPLFNGEIKHPLELH